MTQALAMASEAAKKGEVPIGAVILDQDGQLLAAAYNQKETDQDPTAHAELLAIRAAAQKLGSWRLLGCTLYTTLEPCPMCAGAILQARIAHVVIAAPDLKWGGVRTKADLFSPNLFNHHVSVTWLSPEHPDALEAVAQLQLFFQGRRKKVFNR